MVLKKGLKLLAVFSLLLVGILFFAFSASADVESQTSAVNGVFPDQKESEVHVDDVGEDEKQIKEIIKSGIGGGSGGSGIRATKLKNADSGSSLEKKFTFTGIMNDYDGNILKASLIYISGEVIDKIEFNNFTDGPENPFFEILIDTPVPEQKYIGNPSNVVLNFHLNNEYFEENGYDLEMNYCILSLNTPSIKDTKSIKFSEDSFENSKTVSLTPGNYWMQVVCSNKDAGFGFSKLVKFKVLNSIGSEEGNSGFSSSGRMCKNEWICGEWSECNAGEQTRLCESEKKEGCYTIVSAKPAEIQGCTELVSETIEEADEVSPQGALARITGAVVGFAGAAGIWGAILFIAVVAGAAGAIAVRNKLKK